MAVTARNFDVEHSMEVKAPLARLEERSEHLQGDVGEIKADLRRVDSKVDAVKDELSGLAQKVASSESSIVKWIVGTAIASTAVAVGIAKFVH